MWDRKTKYCRSKHDGSGTVTGVQMLEKIKERKENDKK